MRIASCQHQGCGFNDSKVPYRIDVSIDTCGETIPAYNEIFLSAVISYAETWSTATHAVPLSQPARTNTYNTKRRISNVHCRMYVCFGPCSQYQAIRKQRPLPCLQCIFQTKTNTTTYQLPCRPYQPPSVRKVQDCTHNDTVMTYKRKVPASSI